MSSIAVKAGPFMSEFPSGKWLLFVCVYRLGVCVFVDAGGSVAAVWGCHSLQYQPPRRLKRVRAVFALRLSVRNGKTRASHYNCAMLT